MVVGRPTTVLDLGGLRIVSDPTFDAPGPHGYLTRRPVPRSPRTSSGRWTWCWSATTTIPITWTTVAAPLALSAPLVLTTRGGAGRLGPPAVGLAPCDQPYRASSRRRRPDRDRRSRRARPRRRRA